MEKWNHEIHARLATDPHQPVEIKNRILRPGHGTYYGKGEITDSLIAYHEAPARSGVGLSTLEVCCVHPSTSSNRTLYGWDDRIIPGFKRISNAMRRHGMKLFVQLRHGVITGPTWMDHRPGRRPRYRVPGRSSPSP